MLHSAGRRSGTHRPLVGLVTLAVVFALAGCTSTPTAPSTTSGPVVVATISQEPPPVPPRLDGPNGLLPPTGALGATRFLGFGDSITVGIQATPDGAFLFAAASGAYPERLQFGLAASHPNQSFVVSNAGISGETAATGERRIQGALLSNAPQALLLLEGINDMNGAGASPNRAAASVHQIVQTARLYNTTVFVALMFQTYEVVHGGQTKTNAATSIVAFNNELRRLAAGLPNVHIVDLYTSFGSNRSFVGGDGLHPTPAGYERMAETFLNAIEAVYPVRGSLQ